MNAENLLYSCFRACYKTSLFGCEYMAFLPGTYDWVYIHECTLGAFPPLFFIPCQLAERHHNFILLRRCTLGWQQSARESVSDKEACADQLHQHVLLRRSLTCWKRVRIHLHTYRWHLGLTKRNTFFLISPFLPAQSYFHFSSLSQLIINHPQGDMGHWSAWWVWK